MTAHALVLALSALGVLALHGADFTFLDGGWAVEWRTYTASYVDAPGDAKYARGTVLAVFKKFPDGSWKIFRAMGSIEPGAPAKAAGW